MNLGKSVPKLVPSFARRRLRLAIAGTPASWAGPAKDTTVLRGKQPQAAKRR